LFQTVRAEVENPKQSTSERLGDFLIGGCQYSKTDKLKPKSLTENLPRTKLAEVKSNLYNPVLSTFRRRDIENVQGKLSDELSGSTLPPGLGINYILLIRQILFVKNQHILHL